MKRVIRRNVFETNSSSMHSIVIMKDDVRTDKERHDKVYMLNENTLDLRYYRDDLNFDRSPFRVLDNAEDKYAYALASKVGNNSYGHINDDGTLDEYLTELVNEFIELAKRVFKGCKKVEFPYNFHGEPCFGWVDHQSAYLLDDFLKKENIDVEKFIRNPKYIVIIDGDEYCIYDDMKECGLIKTENIEREYQA